MTGQAIHLHFFSWYVKREISRLEAASSETSALSWCLVGGGVLCNTSVSKGIHKGDLLLLQDINTGWITGLSQPSSQQFSLQVTVMIGFSTCLCSEKWRCRNFQLICLSPFFLSHLCYLLIDLSSPFCCNKLCCCDPKMSNEGGHLLLPLYYPGLMSSGAWQVKSSFPSALRNSLSGF